MKSFVLKELVCRYDGQCEVTTLTRKVCAACRLGKCLSVGMSPELIRKEDSSAIKQKFRLSEKTNELNVMVRTS